MFIPPTRAVSRPSTTLPKDSVFTVRESSLEDIVRGGAQLPHVRRDRDTMCKYACALSLTELPGRRDHDVTEGELQKYVEWALVMEDAEWEHVATEIRPQLTIAASDMKLEIDLVRGVGLRGKDLDGLSDPYVPPHDTGMYRLFKRAFLRAFLCMMSPRIHTTTSRAHTHTHKHMHTHTHTPSARLPPTPAIA